MSQLFNVIGRNGKPVKNGADLTLEDAKVRALAFAKRSDFTPQVLPVGREIAQTGTANAPVTQEATTVAVAQARVTCRMARYIWRHQRAILDAQVKGRDGQMYEKFHWSGILNMAINNAEIVGKRLEFLNEKFLQVKSAVDAHQAMGSTYTILDPEKARFYFGK